MLVTLWLFLGIEGAVVVSGKAKSQAAVRKATTIGFLVTLALYIVVSLLPLGVYSQADIGAMADPSMAAIMLDKFGSWGEIMVNAGVIVSVLSSWLVWMLMLGEMPLAASNSGIFPKAFAKENKQGSPSTALLWTTIVIQAVLIVSFFIGSNAWTTMISITSVMALPCYLFCTLFLFKIACKKDYPEGIFASRGMAVFTGAAGSLYGLWLVYAAGLNYLMVACIVYAVGIPLYIVGVRQHNPQAKLFAKTVGQGHPRRGAGPRRRRSRLLRHHVRAREALSASRLCRCAARLRARGVPTGPSARHASAGRFAFANSFSCCLRAGSSSFLGIPRTAPSSA